MKNNIPPQHTDSAPEFHPTDRFLALLASFSNLRQHNRALVGQVRGSMDRLRELSRELSRMQPAPASENGDARLSSHFGLTPREQEVAVLLAQGRSNQAIARELRISVHTARHHTQRILSKLEVHSRGEAGAKLRGDL